MHPTVDLSPYVDDFTVAIHGKSEQKVLQQVAKVSGDLVELIEDRLLCDISVPKAQVAASYDGLLRKARKLLGDRAGPVVGSVEALGLDLAAGRRRAAFHKTSKAVKSHEAFKKRVARLRRLAKVNRAGAEKIIRSGAFPAGDFGKELHGASDAVLRDYQSKFLSVVTPIARGRDRAVTLLLNNDPTWRLAVAPVVQFAKEAWRSLLCPGRQGITGLGQLGAMWRQIKQQTPKRWMDIRCCDPVHQEAPLGVARALCADL